MICSAPSRSSIWIWVSAAGLLGGVGGWSFLSQQFVYGQDHAQRPILGFLLLFGLAWLSYLLAVYVTWKKGGRVSLGGILLVAIISRLILIPSELIQENDVYRYVLDGQVLLHGENPYEFSPLARQETQAEAGFRVSGSEVAETVLNRISYPQIPTVYPPLAQAVFAGGALVGGWQWQSQRSILLLVDFLTLAGLLALIDLLGICRGWILLYAWNPLLLKEVANSTHPDVLVALFLVLTLLAAARAFSQNGRNYLLLLGVGMGAAILSKLYPLLLLPALLIFIWRRSRRFADVIGVGAVTGAVVLAGYLPFLEIGWEKLTLGLRIYASDWTMNEGFFSILSTYFPRPRLWFSGLVVAFSLFLPALWPAPDVRGLARQMQWILLFWFLVMPAPFPWYALPLVALMVVSSSSVATSAVLMLSGAASLYYLRFYFEYHQFSDWWWSLTRGVEHGLIWATILVAGALAWAGKLKRPDQNRPLPLVTGSETP